MASPTNKALSALISVLLLYGVTGQSAELGGYIDEDTTLTILNSPYDVRSNIIIAQNVTLTVDPGVELQFQPGVGVVVGGALVASGTESDRIKFTASKKESFSIPVGYYQIKLTDGRSPHEGRLEVFANGQWGTVCDDYWGSADTQVACRQLGYQNGYTTYNFPDGTGHIWLSEVGCSGDELLLWDCDHRGIGVHSCDINHSEDIGLVCENPYVEAPMDSLWAGIEWPGERSSMQSLLRYTDIEYAGLTNINDGILRDVARPALSAVGVPPVLESVDVINNIQDGVKFSQIPNSATLSHGQMSHNGGTGLHTSTIGIGRFRVTGTEIVGNGGYGMYYGGNAYPEDSNHYKFCGDVSYIDEYVYLDHAISDFVDPYECVQVFNSPLGTTLTAYLLSGSSSQSSYTGLEFWNGNTTQSDKLLASIHLHETNGELITTTTNSMRVRVYRSYSSYTTFFTLLITVQKDLDYDIELNNMTITKNSGGVTLQQIRRRLFVVDSAITDNLINGINVEVTYGQLLLRNTTISLNRGTGFESLDSYGEISIDTCSFQFNENSAIRFEFATRQENHVYVLSINKTKFTGNGDIAIFVQTVNHGDGKCDEYRSHFEMMSCYLFDEQNGGVNFLASCSRYYYGKYVNAQISQNTFSNIGQFALAITWVQSMTLDHNQFDDNYGTNVLLITLPYNAYSTQSVSLIQENTFIENLADVIVYFDGSQYSRDIEIIFEDNVLANNTCSVALKIQFNPYGYMGSADTFAVRHNRFTYNIPYSFQEQCVPFIPIAVISYDRPYISLRSNIIENPLFPLQLIITGEYLGTISLTDLNWWGTDDEYKIQELIWDGLDRYEFPRAEYFPFLLSANLTDAISQNASRSFVPFERDGVIGGVMRGNVTLCNTTTSYYVDRDITIPQSYELNICPGVTLEFYYFSAIFVQGKLLANAENDERIVLKYNSFSSNSRLPKPSRPIRLVDGDNAWTGRLELSLNGQWYSFCGSNWTLTNALVACRQLGFLDVADTKSYFLQAKTVILDYQVQCKGKEYDLMDCSLHDDVSRQCDYYSSVVHVECSRPEWTGVVLPANNDVSILRHIRFENAGSRYIDSTKVIEDYGAIYLHLHHHEIQDIEIISSNIGIRALYTDPHDLIRPIESISIKDCSSGSFASHLHSWSFHLKHWDVSNCYGGIYVEVTENPYEDLLRMVDPSNKLSACHADVTLDKADILILSPPLTDAMYCDGVFTVTNKNSNGRIGALLLYSSNDTKISVEDGNGILLTVEGSISESNSVVSNTPTMTIRHQSRYPKEEYNFHLLVKALDGNNHPFHQQPNRFSDKEEYSDLDIFNSTFSNCYYGIRSRSAYYIDLKSNKTMTVDNTRFYLIKTRAVDIYELFDDTSSPNDTFDAHWIFKSCTFENTEYGIYIYSRSDLYYQTSFVIVPRFTIVGCRFVETSQFAIRQYYYSNYDLWNLSIMDSEFRNNHDTVLKIDRAGKYSSLSVINNTFDFNDATVLQIPNELQRCTIKDNLFSNNTAPYIVEYFQAVRQTAAMTTGFNHVFSGNKLLTNHPKSTSTNNGLVCVIITSVMDGVFQHNTFDNEEFCYEFCFGTFTYFDVHKSLDATLNNWNRGNDSEISDRIYDIDDWNDRPAVSFLPYLSSAANQRPMSNTYTNCPHKTSLGGRIFQDTTLSSAESPYSIQSDITVLENVTLTIEPGVEVVFEPNVGVLILGRLIARGTEHDRIEMKAINYYNQWGGIRIVHSNESNLPESVLEYLDIVSAGYLHVLSTPALSIRHASPYIQHVNVINSREDGILVDTPSSKFSLKNINVNEATNGVVLYNVGHEDFHLSNVTSKENDYSGFMVNQHDDGKAFSTCYLKTIPICAPQSDEVIVVDKNADMLMHIPPVINYRGSSPYTTECSILIQPMENQILVLHLYRAQYYYSYDYIYIYEGTTSNKLGSLRYDDEYLTVVSPVSGGALRFYSYYYVSRETETHIRVISTNDNKTLHHTITDSVAADNRNDPIKYSSNPFGLQDSNTPSFPYKYYLTFERCQIISNRGSSADYAMTLHIDKGSKFLIENCLISHNENLGGIFVAVEDGSTGDGLFNHILNNEFIINWDGEGLVNIEVYGSSSDHVQIYGNIMLHNSPLDSATVVSVYEMLVDLDTNVIYNNTGGGTFHVKQSHKPAQFQKCTNNLISYNLGQDINEKYSLETDVKAIQFYQNVIQNPVYDFEIYAPPGSGVSNIINATYNWWGTTDGEFIDKRLRDSDYVSGSPDIIFKPLLSGPPANVQTYLCPIGYFVRGSNCYGYKGGAVNFNEAFRSCQFDASALPTQPSAILQDILRNRTQFSTNPSGIWLYPVTLNEDNPSQRQCSIMELSESENDKGVRDLSCYAKRPYICTRSAKVKCPNACFGNGLCHGATCVCNAGWKGADCSKFHCRDVNDCSGFGTCVGPNQCKCRGGWQGRACSTSYCSRFDRCRPCAVEDGCGWCDTKQLCLPGTPLTPDKELCDNWFYHNCFTTGEYCSDTIEKFDCAFRQCNKTSPDTNKELCKHCLNVQNCFNTDPLCPTWDENRCPEGIVFPKNNDTSRIRRVEIDKGVIVLDKDISLDIYPVANKECQCLDGSYDILDPNGQCPCLCQCNDCTNSTIGPTGCICQDICPPCLVDEKQIWVNCQCHCKGDNECGILPTCVLGRKGPECDILDCFPHQDCFGNGNCISTPDQCSSFCNCTDGWQGHHCQIRVPTTNFGDPHLETIDGSPYDFFGIGEFVFCQSRVNDFGVHSRLFYYETASLIGAVAVKAGDTVITITTPGTRSIDLPYLRVNGDLYEVQDKLKYTFGNSTVILDIQQPVSIDSSSAVAVAILSFQFLYGTTFTIEVRHSDDMQRQYLNVMFAPSVNFRETTEGLCGFMDNDYSNDFRGPDGVTFADPIHFAESWRISSSQLYPGLHGSWSWNESNFHVNDTMDNSYTDPSYTPVYNIDDLPEEQKQKAIEICSALDVEGSLLDACIYDVAVTNDTSFSEQEALKTGCPSRCSGKGTCVNSTCECLEGWSGEDCHIGECGECVNGLCDAGFCTCDVGWEGSTCNIEAMCHLVNNCTDLTHGRCLRTDVCICNEGYTGVDCSLSATCYNVFNCSNNGVCVDFDVCNCGYGWRGAACNTTSCEALNFCSENGDCVDLDVCECQDGWKQPSCGTPDCTALDECSQNGYCIAPDTCECYNGFIGSNCDQLLNCSLLNNCNENGVCVQDGDGQLTCRCDIGYTGLDCGEVTCINANDCSGHGSCVEPNLCECSLGYAGYECADYSCQLLGFCSGHGECINYDVCNCTEGWFGLSCDIPTCYDVNNCTNQGLCIDLNVCHCNEGFEGIRCDTESLPNAAVPTFSQSEYNVTIMESTLTGSVIHTVEANDTDVGRNGELSYSFGFETDYFTIGSSTGDISTRATFDYESAILPNLFNLIAIVEDNGRPIFSSSATIRVFIADVNDNCPELTSGETITNVELPSFPPIGTFIHQIFAEDLDDELNGELVYSFYQVPETITNLFTVSDNGTVYTLATLPPGTYAISVSVSDQGDPPCAIIIQVNVNSLPGTTFPPPTTTRTSSNTTMPTTTTIHDRSPMTTIRDICRDDNDCGEYGTCKAGVCECACLYVGTTCSKLAQCYDCNMVVDGLYEEPAEFTEDLKNPESEEFKRAVDTLLPFIEVVISDTNTVVEAFITAAISHFSPGSLVVDYTITLTEGADVSVKQLEDEMNEALNLHLNYSNVLARKDSISVSEHQIPIEEGPLNMVIFTYVGCCVAILGTLLIIVTYLPSCRLLMQQEACQILINFCVSLIGQYGVYLSLSIIMEQGERTARQCNALAGLLHYFVLATAAWAGMESISVCSAHFNRYLKYHGYFFQTILMFILACLAWGIPAVIVGITSQVAKPDYFDEVTCFLKSDHSIFSALIPLAIVIILVVILYTYVWIKIKKKSALEEGTSERQLLVRIKKDAIILLLLILTWVSGYLAILPSTSYVAQPFFWLISTLTGFALFVFFVIWRPGAKVEAKEDKEEDDTISTGQGSQILMVQRGSSSHPDEAKAEALEDKEGDDKISTGQGSQILMVRCGSSPHPGKAKAETIEGKEDDTTSAGPSQESQILMVQRGSSPHPGESSSTTEPVSESES